MLIASAATRYKCFTSH